MREDSQRVINNNIRNYFRPFVKINSIILNTGNTLEHELKKVELCYKLQREGHSFIVEAELQSGGRPDVTVVSTENPIAYEIMASESDDSISAKRDKYPFRIVEVRL